MEVRIDKWLWAVRLFKTRSLSTEACQKGRIFVNDMPAKPSRMVRVGDIIKVRRSPVIYTFKVLQVAEKRMGAALTSSYIEDLTPPEELEILDVQKNMSWMKRDRGTGRPSKKERRDLDNFFDTDF